MKTFRIFVAICIALVGVLTEPASAQNKSEKEARLQKLLTSRNFVFIAETAIPMGGGNIRLTSSNYQLALHKDSLDSFLPYFGTAYRAEYGSSQSPLTFTSSDFTYDSKPSKKGGQTITIKLNTPNDPDLLILSVSRSGYATLQVNSINRQPISFYGTIAPRRENAL